MFNERDKIQKLITDTIVTLCNSGLTFDTELSVEGLLGITLDHKDILLVNISEIIKTQQNGSLHSECRSPDKELVASRNSAPSRSSPTFDDYSDANTMGLASTREDEEGSEDNDLFECPPEPQSAEVDDFVDSEQESYERIHSAQDASEGDYKDHNDDNHMIVIKEEPDDYIDCEQQTHMSTTAQRHVFPELTRETFSHMSSSEMPPSNNTPATASYTPITNNVNSVGLPSLYSEHIKDEPLEGLNQTNNEVVNSWFNTVTARQFDVSGSSLMSTPNPQQRLWSSPKQFASSGMLHLPNAEQVRGDGIVPSRPVSVHS